MIVRWFNFPPLYDLRNASNPDRLNDVGRPSTIRVRDSALVHLSDFRIRDSPTWTMQIIASDYIHLNRLQLHVNTSEYCFSGGDCYQAANVDGIDFGNCRHV